MGDYVGYTEYVYDDRGNIRQKLIYNSDFDLVDSVVYGYGNSTWTDALTSYEGESFSYDAMGNPLNWTGGRTLTWTNGRNLASMGGVTFTYDADGLRTGKTSSSKSTAYYALNGKYVGEKTVINGTAYYISYYYDENGTPMGVNVNGSAYFFVKNLQGDVTDIMSYTGTVVAKYTYDAWGKLLSVRDGNNQAVTSPTHIANLNPFRYRGYIYDTETGLYYLNSRYYDAEVGRFLNPDQYISTGQGVLSFNMYAYCGNNPVNRADPTGTFWKEVGNFFKNVGTAIYNGAKKLVKATGGSFQIEGGVGYGLGASAKIGPVKASATAYQDGLTVGLKNGSTYTAIKGSAGISAQITKKASVGLSTEYEHRFETDSVRDWDEHTTMSAPWEVYNCPKTVKDPLQFSFPIAKPIEGDLSQGLFIGISAEAHIGVGGHFTIGWDATEFWRILTE